MYTLECKTIRIRSVETRDAKFILSLRLNEKYNSFISSVSNDVKEQEEWLEKYKEREIAKKEFYFIIERLDNSSPCGTVRLYDLRGDSFCWGSWILNENKTKYSAIESALLVYKFGFNYLNYNNSHFDVMKNNVKVISFHEKMGAIKVGETDDSFLFTIDKNSVLNFESKFKGKFS